MSSNIKLKTPAKEAPNEPFKRAVTGCLRAIARRPELEVSFAAERPGMAGGKARLPEPPRKLTAADAAIVRGHADAIALRMACHDDAIHRRLLAGAQCLMGIFDHIVVCEFVHYVLHALGNGEVLRQIELLQTRGEFVGHLDLIGQAADLSSRRRWIHVVEIAKLPLQDGEL